MEKLTSHPSFGHRLVSILGAAFLHLVGKTSFVFQSDHPAAMELRRKKKKVIYAFWHNNQVFLAYHHRGEGVHIMVSQSKDGEYIAQVMKKMGLNAVRGSSSRGGSQALREILSILTAGGQIGFTPDGPKGPVQSVQGGVVAAAKLSECPIVPTAVYARRKLVFNSWDKFFVPLPFNVITVAHGRPFTIPQSMDENAAKEKVREALNNTTDLAAREGEENGSWRGAVLSQLYFLISTLMEWVLSPILFLALLNKFGFEKTFNGLPDRFAISSMSQLPALETGKRVWLHVASVGEWQAVRPVLKELKKEKDLSFVITATMIDAIPLISSQEPDIPVKLCPLDFSFVVNRWINQMNPDALIIVETELWPQLIHVSNQKQIPVFIINGRFSEKASSRWKWFLPLIKKILGDVTWMGARNESDAQRFQSTGALRYRVDATGNTKFDNLHLYRAEERAELRNKWFGPLSDLVLLGGSTRDGEEKILFSVTRAAVPQNIRLILAPRQLSRIEELVRLAQSMQLSIMKWSEVKKGATWTSAVLLVDTLGDLKDLYATSDIAYVGGSLKSHGGQNPLEPAAAGIPVLFGPSMENFQDEALDLVKAGAARQAREENDLIGIMHEISQNASLRETMGQAAQECVRRKLGASVRTAEKIKELLRY